MIKREFHNTLIVGTGCAGYACAYYLDKLGRKDTLIVCENKDFGTSRNTGSDKQTYYKLSLCGSNGDSVYQMANDLYSFGGVNGDNALCEAASSAQCFLNLVSLGVPFPKNEYGEFVGYKTDHDTRSRATSAGPLTSKYMIEALEKEVNRRGISIREGLVPIKIIKKNDSAVGCLFVDAENKFTLISCSNLVFATGGEASLFRDSVYPKSQLGAMGVLIDAGVKLGSFNHWQFGIASVDFRWNLSGSYQQVIPRYISVDSDGNKKEFLREHLDDENIFNLTFLKGYEWPFDSRKRDKSSLIDILVKAETDKGNDVFLDYSNNPTGFAFSALSDVAYSYLKNSNSLCDTPVQRLKMLNPKAYELYKSNGIDLDFDLLRIAVCAQHQNGGACIDFHYETNVKGLFVIGEASGVYGAYRPGGTALNSTQVGAMRCAEKIAGTTAAQAECDVDTTDFDGFDINIDSRLFAKWQENNSRLCSISRNTDEIKKAIPELERDMAACRDYKTLDMLKATYALYKSCIFAGENVGSHGSAIYSQNEIERNKNKIITFDNGECYFTEPKPIPESEQWFEAVYNSNVER